MEFQVLGPLEVHREGGLVALGPAKQRAVLAILLVRANELVSSDRLIEELWPEPPKTAANTLQVYVGRLRKALEPGRTQRAPGELLATMPPGYLLRIAPDELDADRFERLVGEGRDAAAARDPAAAAARLRQALALWRGPALADFAYDPFAQAEIARLEELRLDAIEDRIEAELAVGRAADLVGELESADRRKSSPRALARAADARALPRRPPGRRARGLQPRRAGRSTKSSASRRAHRCNACRRRSSARSRRSRSRSRPERRPSCMRRRPETAALRAAKDGHRADRAASRARAAWTPRPSATRTSSIATISPGPWSATEERSQPASATR